MHAHGEQHGTAPDTVREVVAAVLTHGGRIGLFRRSARVSGDTGRWHCITGHLPAGADPHRHALIEIAEETGMEGAGGPLLTGRAVLELEGGDGVHWRVHAFHFSCAHDTVRLNWEHDACCWLAPDDLGGLATVSWLERVLAAVLPAPVGQGP
ncbi:NUDIX domain-containing protein [Pseudoduganella namucuonensis]|uniref:NUDIX domain-containing protein n=1 Tax=Pseudoduganella namucuonensis TaxID=1035707 RepID=A0A1I7KYU8_9BURK|nr:NUDIX domain-containing protein [Pseudoduganella namucuonensis]SFV02621.1 NUDIX domain-containing protein [Pseudoduganella namucuonensis]